MKRRTSTGTLQTWYAHVVGSNLTLMPDPPPSNVLHSEHTLQLCFSQLASHAHASGCSVQFEAYGEEEIEAVVECLRDGFLAPGPRTEMFEQQVATLFAKEAGLMVNSGSSANLIALNAFGFKPGDEVVTAACTFSTVVAPLTQLGVKPIFVDVHPTAYVPEVDDIIDAITPQTVLIWLPNLVGSKPDWEAIRRRTDLPLWEDSCDCITSTPVTDVSMTSFYASHMITAGGGGGMIMANSSTFIDKCRMVRHRACLARAIVCMARCVSGRHRPLR